MARFVLVHGAWQGLWCWREVTPRLTVEGHDAAALDLPGHGRDKARPEIVTMQHYVDRIRQEILVSAQDVILVGHSMGGVVSQAAEEIHARVRALVYIAALVPPNGCEMLKFVASYDPQFVKEFVWSSDGRTAGITPDGARQFLYTHCATDDVESVLPLFTAEPVAPFATPVTLTDRSYGRIPRYYIECLRDRAVPIELQRSMQAATSFQGIYSINTDHSPFFSMPQKLAEILHDIAKHL